MFLRVAVVVGACALSVVSAAAEELGPDQARAFVVGKLFAYTCFDGTAGMGRIFADGSVVGTIRPSGRGEVRFASLPAGTIRVDGAAMCAHLAGLPLQPCFRVQKIDYRSFRGSVSGLGFAYCDFFQHNPRAQIISSAPALDLNADVTGGLPVRDPHNDAANRAPALDLHAAVTSRAPALDLHAAVTSRVPAPAPVEAAPMANLRPAIND
jgi:hypothetical protein